jgi:hypothetical protein
MSTSDRISVELFEFANQEDNVAFWKTGVLTYSFKIIV